MYVYVIPYWISGLVELSGSLHINLKSLAAAADPPTLNLVYYAKIYFDWMYFMIQ